MFENFLGMLRKRRRVDEQQENNPSSTDSHPRRTRPNLTANTFWDSLFFANNSHENLPHETKDDDGNANTTTTNVVQTPLAKSNNDLQLDRFVTVLDQLDARVEKFRKDALGLQEKRDFLLMSIDLIKSNDLMQNMSESEREEIICYIQRVNSRLSTVELNVRTVRDRSQEDSLSQINALIDMMITMGDPVHSRQRCQQYLNACCSFAETGGSGSNTSHLPSFPETSSTGLLDVDAGPVDKKFESALLGCTLDDQKNIKKRLQALMGYLNKQTIRD